MPNTEWQVFSAVPRCFAYRRALNCQAEAYTAFVKFAYQEFERFPGTVPVTREIDLDAIFFRTEGERAYAESLASRSPAASWEGVYLKVSQKALLLGVHLGVEFRNLGAMTAIIGIATFRMSTIPTSGGVDLSPTSMWRSTASCGGTRVGCRRRCRPCSPRSKFAIAFSWSCSRV